MRPTALGASALIGALVVAACGGGGNGSSVPQPVISARAKGIITVDGKQFKDLMGDGKLYPYEDWRLPLDQRIDDLVARMTLEEKVGLMTVDDVFVGGASGSFCKDGETAKPYVCEKPVVWFGIPSSGTSDMINKHGSRYLAIRDNPDARTLAVWINNIQEIAEGSRLGIPAVTISNPRNHAPGGDGFSEASGVFSYWPGTLGLAATHDPALVREFAEIAAKEWVATGVRKGYMYQADLATQPTWTRANGTFGDDPDLVAKIQTELVLGFQGKALGPTSVALTTKHFPGGGPTPDGIAIKSTVYPTAGSLVNYQLKPFQAAIDAGTSSVMTRYEKPQNAGAADQLPKTYWFSEGQQFEEVGAAFDKKLQDYLRNQMGFKGYINSDSSVMVNEGAPVGVETLASYQRETKALNAGINLVSLGSGTVVNGQATVIAHEDILKIVKEGLVKEEIINGSVKRLLKEMFQLGLFESPFVDPANAVKVVHSAEAQAKADLAHRKSIVLLKNDGLLPLKTTADTAVKLYAEVFTAGTKAATQTAALRNLLKTTYPNAVIVDDYTQATHAFLMVVPNNATVTDVNAKSSITLGTATGVNVDKIKAIQASNAKTILAVNMGNPWLLNEIEPKAAAIIAAYDVTTDALLDVVGGKFNPSGKLPMAIPASLDAVNKKAPDTPGHFAAFDYAYKDSKSNIYTFGFGLNYK